MSQGIRRERGMFGPPAPLSPPPRRPRGSLSGMSPIFPPLPPYDRTGAPSRRNVHTRPPEANRSRDPPYRGRVDVDRRVAARAASLWGLAVGVAATGVVASLWSRFPFPPIQVAERVANLTPGGVATFFIDLLHHLALPLVVLLVGAGLVAITLGLAALLPRLAERIGAVAAGLVLSLPAYLAALVAFDPSSVTTGRVRVCPRAGRVRRRRRGRGRARVRAADPAALGHARGATRRPVPAGLAPRRCRGWARRRRRVARSRAHALRGRRRPRSPARRRDGGAVGPAGAPGAGVRGAGAGPPGHTDRRLLHGRRRDRGSVRRRGRVAAPGRRGGRHAVRAHLRRAAGPSADRAARHARMHLEPGGRRPDLDGHVDRRPGGGAARARGRARGGGRGGLPRDRRVQRLAADRGRDRVP